MISRWARRWAPKLFKPAVSELARLGITPNGLTVAGLVLAALSGLSIALDHFLIAAAFLLFSALCDSLDGEMARQQISPSRLGPFIDSVADHYGDFAIYLGLAWRAVNSGDRLMIFLVLAAMFGSLVGSHVRSRAGMAGVDTRSVGIFTRMERTLVLLLGLVTGLISPAVGLIGLFANLSALQRVLYTLKVGSRASSTQAVLDIQRIDAAPNRENPER